jgi:ATP/maltotriose-dependent transcriptional regulator MalT/DNA-binding SARP family transcriptional activator
MRHKQTSINKITPPALPKVVLRKRLFSLLDNKQHYQVTWVSGVAGSGKTTLTASYLNNGNFPCLWYQMDEGDDDIATFFYYLGLAAKKATPRKRKPLPLLTPEYFPGISVFARRFFENLCSRVSPPFYLIFDNYHEISLASPFHEVFKDALSGISPDIHVIVMSRTDPPQAFAGMLANNKMRIIGSDNLCLNLDESKEIIRIETGKKFSGKIIKRIHEKTQGWAAGLILMAKSTGTDDTIPQPFEKFIPEKIFEYFAIELFDKMNKNYREFLLKTAFLPSITTSMAKALTGKVDANRILSSLRSNHLFTEKFSTPARFYQYHPLFREFLIARAEDTFDKKELLMLQQRAAELLEASGQVEDAVDLFFKAKDYKNLIILFLKQAKELITQGRNKTLEQWIKKVPEDILNKEPWLLYCLGMSCLHFSSAEARGYFKKALDLFKQSKDMAGLYLSWSGIIDSFIYEWNYFTKIDHWIEWFDKHIPDKRAFPSLEIEARVAVSMMFALMVRKPDHPDMIQWIEKALSLSRDSGNIYLYMRAIDYSIMYYLWIGDFAKAEIIHKESQELAKSHRTSPAMVIQWKLLNITIRLFTMREIDSVAKEISDTLVIIKKNGLHVMEQLFFMSGIFISLLIGDLSSAKTFLKRFESILDISHYHSFGIFHHFTGLYNLHTGNITQAKAHAETALKISDETGAFRVAIGCRFQLASILHELGEVQKCKEELSLTYDIAVKMKNRIFEFMCLMLKANIALDVKSNQKKEKAGLKFLRKAMLLGRKQGYFNMAFWWYSPVIAKLCAKALIESIEVDYVKRLIRIHKLTLKSPPYHIENWPWALKIHTLNRFQIIKNDEPIRFSGKAQKKPFDLLKVLIAYGGIEVNVDQIIDALWYDADGDMAHSAFSTTLNRLRKLIGIKDVINLDDGKVSLNQNYCQVDTWAFERILKEAKTLWEKGEVKKAIFLYEKAINSYRGHFLAKESQEPWIIPLRERLKNRFLRAIIKLGKCREQEKAFEKTIECYEKGLAVDNLEEVFYQRIMLCCQNLGRKAEAIRVYNRCREALQTILKIEPSHETEVIYQKILNRG